MFIQNISLHNCLECSDSSLQIKRYLGSIKPFEWKALNLIYITFTDKFKFVHIHIFTSLNLETCSDFPSNVHASDQRHFKDVLGVRWGVSHADIQGSVNAVGHLPQVAICLLSKPIVRHIDVWEHAVQMKTCLLTWKQKRETIYISILQKGFCAFLWSGKTLMSKCCFSVTTFKTLWSDYGQWVCFFKLYFRGIIGTRQLRADRKALVSDRGTKLVFPWAHWPYTSVPETHCHWL